MKFFISKLLGLVDKTVELLFTIGRSKIFYSKFMYFSTILIIIGILYGFIARLYEEIFNKKIKNNNLNNDINNMRDRPTRDRLTDN